MAVYKSSFTRALKPNVLNKYMIEMLCCILISISVLIASVQKNIFFQDLKYSVVSFSKPFIFSIAKPFEYFNNFLLYIGDLKSAHDQNKVLKKQNHEFRILLNEKDFYYFVHSYFVKPNDATSVVATYDFGGHQIPAIVSKDNLIGCQFHPEKSGKKGLELISNFLNLSI